MVQVCTTTLDKTILQNVHINKITIERQVQNILLTNIVTNPERYRVWLLKAVSLIDLTTLSGDDTRSNVVRLCAKVATTDSAVKQLLQVMFQFERLIKKHVGMDHNGIWSTLLVGIMLPNLRERPIQCVDKIWCVGEYKGDLRSLSIVNKAADPLPAKLLNNSEVNGNKTFTTAAVCVYPNRVRDAYDSIKKLRLLNEIQIASVATGFPSGLYPLESRFLEIKFAIANGATEIDVVLDRSLILMGKWDTVYDEVLKMRKECGTTHLKVILGVGELGSYENVYKASMVSMLAGADFIKTSTGKEAVNATLPVGLVMCRAIRHYYDITGRKVGLKPAGGIKTARDAVNWLVLVHTELGPQWLTPKLFRIGASSLLGVIENALQQFTANKDKA